MASMFNDLMPTKVPTDFFPKRHLMDAMYRATLEFDSLGHEFAGRAAFMKPDEARSKHARMRHLGVLRRGYMRRLAMLEVPPLQSKWHMNMRREADVWFPLNIISTMALIVLVLMIVGQLRIAVGGH